MAIVSIIYVLGYILTGVKPLQMLVTGVLAAIASVLTSIAGVSEVRDSQ